MLIVLYTTLCSAMLLFLKYSINKDGAELNMIMAWWRQRSWILSTFNLLQLQRFTWIKDGKSSFFFFGRQEILLELI